MRTHENEPFVVNREVRAVMVPAGVEVNLKPGQAGYITQALGGSFTVYIEGKELVFYYYAFYDLNYYARNLGMFMMTSAVSLFAERGLKHLYLGTCYSQNALYKTQFAGSQFFTGFRWSDDMNELKFVINRDKKDLDQHLLETESYRNEFYGGDLGKITNASEFRVKVK